MNRQNELQLHLEHEILRQQDQMFQERFRPAQPQQRDSLLGNATFASFAAGLGANSLGANSLGANSLGANPRVNNTSSLVGSFSSQQRMRDMQLLQVRCAPTRTPRPCIHIYISSFIPVPASSPPGSCRSVATGWCEVSLQAQSAQSTRRRLWLWRPSLSGDGSRYMVEYQMRG